MAINGEALNEEDPASEHARPSVRMCKVDKNESGSCGFHLTKTKWDPYPWIAGVDDGSPAKLAGLKVGDCVLEINGEDVLGLRVGEIATKALSVNDYITMLLWNAGSDSNCESESLCCTPMPTSLSRLSVCLSSILSFLECPICFELIGPPAHQCPLGHLICFRCRVYIERCPICRTSYTRERSLLADQIYNAIIEAFHLNNQSTSERTKKLWERVFGKKKREKRSQSPMPKTNRAMDLKNKFLTRLIGKAVSVDNLANESIFTNALRKKSISSTDIYPESLKKLSYLHNSSAQCSSESLKTTENGTLSRFSSANSCETLNATRNVQYYNRLRNRNFNDNGENLFQFSSDTADNDDSSNNLYRCPLLERCSPMTPYSLLTHLQQHDGPVIQFFKPKFTVHFPFSFENGAIFIVHFYNKTFFTNISVETNGDIKVYVWIMDTRTEAERFKIKVNLRAEECRTNLKFKTIPTSIKSTENPDNVYNHQIFVTNSTLEVYFRDKFYSLDLHFKTREI